MNNSKSSNGIGFLSLLALLFIGLKLCGVIDWSWWWVTLPLWGGFAVFFGIILLALLFLVLKWAVKRVIRWIRR